MTASHRAAAQANAEVAPQVSAPEAEPATGKAKAVDHIACWLTRCDPPAGWERQHGDKDASSNWRSPPPPAAKSAEQGRPYNQRSRESGRRGEGGGGVRNSEDMG